MRFMRLLLGSALALALLGALVLQARALERIAAASAHTLVHATADVDPGRRGVAVAIDAEAKRDHEQALARSRAQAARLETLARRLDRAVEEVDVATTKPKTTTSTTSTTSTTTSSTSSTTTLMTRKTIRPTSTTTTTTTTTLPPKPTTTSTTTKSIYTGKTTTSELRARPIDTVSPITTWATLPGAPAEWTVHVSNDTERGQGDHGANFRKYSNEQIETRMDAAEASGHIRYRFPRPASAPDKDGNKIMGLVAVRNVAENIGLFLQLLTKIVDAIIVLDDSSTDNTIEEILKVADLVNVEAIITKREWVRNEAQDKNLLLRLARRLHGTAFVVPDYDETFSAACVENDYLRNRIKMENPGSRVGVHWKEYWGGLDYHRVDPNAPSTNFLNRLIPIIFIDRLDGPTYVPEKDKPLKIHYPRIPMTGGGVSFVGNRDCVIVEFRFVSVINVFLKRIWYACFGALHGRAQQALGHMNQLLDETPLLVPADPNWLSDDARRFGESFGRIESWRARQICRWLAAYGRAPFADLPMWNVDWARLGERFAADERAQLTPDDFRGVNFTAVRFMSALASRSDGDGAHVRDLARIERELVGIRPKHIPH